MNKRIKLTKTSVRNLPTETTDYFMWDCDLPRFGVRVKPSGNKTYIVQYRTNGRQRRRKIGSAKVLSADVARDEAKKYLAQVELQMDPARKQDQKAADPWFRDFCVTFAKDYAHHHLKVRTRKEYRNLTRQVILPALGNLRMSEIDRRAVMELKASLATTPTHANHAISVLSSMMSFAKDLGTIPHNPVLGIKRYPAPGRDRYFSDEELSELGFALLGLHGRNDFADTAIDALFFLALTGFRVGEATAIKWVEVDVEGERVKLAETKTGPRTAALAPEAISILDHRKKVSAYVFPGEGLKRPISYSVIKKIWNEAIRAAGIENAHVHDLRHTMATCMAQSGSTAFEIMASMGWTTLSMAQRYVTRAGIGKRHTLSATTRIQNALFSTNIKPIRLQREAQNKNG